MIEKFKYKCNNLYHINRQSKSDGDISMIIDKDWLFTSDEYFCVLRTVEVLVRNNKILVQRDKNGNE